MSVQSEINRITNAVSDAYTNVENMGGIIPTSPNVANLASAINTIPQPTVNDGILTIQKNGTDIATFTANDADNVTANITVPTAVSELTNDSRFITSSGSITGSSGSCTGNAATATKATGDGNGNNIATSLAQLGNSIENRGWNQLVKNGNFVNTTNWTMSRTTISVSGNVATIGVTSTAGTDNYANQDIPMIVGHKYFYSVDVYGHTANTIVGMIYYGTSSNFTQIKCTNANTWERKEGIFTCLNTTYRLVRMNNNQTSTSKVNKYKNYMLVDLTALYGSGNEPTTASDFRKLYPQAYYQYGGIEADYVIEAGTSNGWTYQKWNSGKIEAWYFATPAITSWSAWGGIYESNLFQAPTYPAITINNKCISVGLLPWNNNYGMLNSVEVYNENNILYYYFLRGAAASGSTQVNVCLYLRGTT